jgi:NAD-reducing hydrogenase small subunit
MSKIRFATTWLDGCSGCHMSFLDLDERLIDIAEHIDLVYSPLVDFKEYPADVDVCLIEGAVSSEEDLHKVRMVRERTKLLVAFGDCAVTTNVPGMRNAFGPAAVLKRAYFENATLNQQVPSDVVPPLLPKVLPVHHVVHVDLFLPGCPPSAQQIWRALSQLIHGAAPDGALASAPTSAADDVVPARFGR